MYTWLQIILSIFLILGLLAGIGVGIYFLYKNMNKKGTCTFIAYDPNNPSNSSNRSVQSPDGLVQVGYINCYGGGALWKPSNITIYNNGPGDFYLGPIPGASSPTLIAALSSLTISQGNVDVNVFMDSTSQYSTPNFSIST